MSRWQIMTGSMALAIVGITVWVRNGPVDSAGPVFELQPMTAQIKGGFSAEAADTTIVSQLVGSEPVQIEPPLQTTSPADVFLPLPKGAELPADPVIPIPLYHPRADVVGGIYTGGLLPFPATPRKTDECDETKTEVPVMPLATPEPPLITPVVSVSAPTPPAWRLSLEMTGNRTHCELRRGEESMVRLQCESLDCSTPSGSLVARGKVVLSGPCLEARCERVTIAWPSGEVALDGGVQLTFRNDGVAQTMWADALRFRLGE